jgi:hypothetical protein
VGEDSRALKVDARKSQFTIQNSQTAMLAADIDALVGRFLDRTLPKAEWTHQAHLTVGAWHVDRYGPDEALTRLRNGIRALNDSHGTVNAATSGYHETVTRAYVRVIASVLGACRQPFAERVAGLLNGWAGERDALLHFYSRDTLASPRARAEWIEPDVRPLPRG